MLPDETFRQLMRDRRCDREREAAAERLVFEVRSVRALQRERPPRLASFGRFLAARRHALP